MTLNAAPMYEFWGVINFYRNDLTECSDQAS